MKPFKEFYLSHKDRLFGYLLRKTGNYQLSADIMQESFVKYLESYRKADSSTALLFTISRNLLIDQYRKQRPEAEFDEQLYWREEVQEKVFIIREESRMVMQAIQELDEDEADILAMAVGSGLTYKEIGKLMKLSEGNVRIKIHRARSKLRQIMDKREQ